MATFMTAYAVVWLALVLYAVRLRTRQRELEQRIVILALQGQHARSGDQSSPEAA